jgi:uncharacterized protein YcgL (UPF0745 family)
MTYWINISNKKLRFRMAVCLIFLVRKGKRNYFYVLKKLDFEKIFYEKSIFQNALMCDL